MTGVTGARRHAAFVARRNSGRHRAVMASGAGGRGNDGMIHGRRLPRCRPVTAIAGGGGVGPAFMVRRNAARRFPVASRTGARGHSRVVKCRRPPGGGPMTAIAGCSRIQATLVASGNTSGGPSMTSCAGPWCHARMVEGRWPPGCRSVAGIASSRGHAAFVAGRNTRRVDSVASGTGTRHHT